MSVDCQRHWENVYTTKDEKEVSWFEDSPAISLALIRSTGLNTNSSNIDIGGGVSRLVDALIDEGFEAVTVLDLSEKAITIAGILSVSLADFASSTSLVKLPCGLPD